MFDFDGTGIENARYVAIFDDGIEDGYYSTAKTVLVPEATYSTVSLDSLYVLPAGETNPTMGNGADIDAISVHQHAMSINYDDLSKDTDSDGYIDAYGLLYGDYANPGKIVSDNRDNTTTPPAT
jgi:hypothetical protein